MCIGAYSTRGGAYKRETRGLDRPRAPSQAGSAPQHLRNATSQTSPVREQACLSHDDCQAKHLHWLGGKALPLRSDSADCCKGCRTTVKLGISSRLPMSCRSYSLREREYATFSSLNTGTPASGSTSALQKNHKMTSIAPILGLG